jgi:uncharacterized protein with LGFP repeats
MFGDRYTSGVLGSLPGSDVPPDDDLTHEDDVTHDDGDAPADYDPWGASPPVEQDEAPGVVDEPDEPDEPDEDDDPDAVDTAPTRVLTVAPVVQRDLLADTGRHARIEVAEPEQRVAFLMPLEDPNEAPEGYPVKASTKSGVYWAPGSALYDHARAEIWFATEELARVNGFVTDDEDR